MSYKSSYILGGVGGGGVGKKWQRLYINDGGGAWKLTKFESFKLYCDDLFRCGSIIITDIFHYYLTPSYTRSYVSQICGMGSHLRVFLNCYDQRFHFKSISSKLGTPFFFLDSTRKSIETQSREEYAFAQVYLYRYYTIDASEVIVRRRLLGYVISFLRRRLIDKSYIPEAQKRLNKLINE